jgi:hypothetical protein
MPKNCKGCVRYKLLTIYQYAQKPLIFKVSGFFYEVFLDHSAVILAERITRPQ